MAKRAAVKPKRKPRKHNGNGFFGPTCAKKTPKKKRKTTKKK